MKKVRSDAAWNKLTEKQREMLDQWLFDQKMGYAKAWKLAKAKFGYSGSESSVKRYFLRRRDEKDLESFTDFQQETATVIGAPGDSDVSRAAVMKVLGQFLFRQVRESPENVKKWGRIAQLLLQNDYNEVLRRTKAEEHRIRREAMAFANRQFEFDTMGVALKALPQLKELEDAKKDPHMKRYEENAYWNQVRQAMFGMGIEVQPESAQEEAEIAAARKAREERRLRDLAAEQNVTEQVQPPTPSSRHYEEYLKAQAKWDLENWEMGTEYEI